MRFAAWSAVPLVALALAAPACISDINTAGKRSGALLVTYRAPGVDFGTFHTFAMATQVAPIDGGPATAPVPVDAPALLGAVSAGLAARGLAAASPVDPSSPPLAPAADLSVNVSLLEPSAPSAPGFWAGGPAQFDPGIWGLPAGTAWVYLWRWVSLDVSPRTILVEMGDLRGAGAGGVAPVVWAVLVQDAAPPGGSYADPGVLEAVSRALAQWPQAAGSEPR